MLVGLAARQRSICTGSHQRSQDRKGKRQDQGRLAGQSGEGEGGRGQDRPLAVEGEDAG
jgi:hypothetical protein